MEAAFCIPRAGSFSNLPWRGKKARGHLAIGLETSQLMVAKQFAQLPVFELEYVHFVEQRGRGDSIGVGIAGGIRNRIT
jgi:hypothetical protein